MYDTIAQLVSMSNQNHSSLWEMVLQSEQNLTQKSKEEIFQTLDQRYAIMEKAATCALERPLQKTDGLINGMAHLQHQYATTAKCGTVGGSFVSLMMARALSCSEVNASMGIICAAPTAGACGVLPAVLLSLAERDSLSRPTMLEALLTAAGIGAVIMQNATVSGAEGGCQAECGVAAAMAASAAVYLAGGSNEQIAEACSIALTNCMGLICDPVAGLVQMPCAFRNASQAMNAIASADMALAGIRCMIPTDQVIGAMFQVGRLLPACLKETAQGGIAATESAREFTQKRMN